MLILKFAWKYFWHAQRVAVGDGGWTADKLHLDIIDAVLEQLDAEDSDTVREQLRHRYFFSWMSKGRINVFFFYDEDGLPLVSGPAFKERAYKVELFVEGRKHTALVVFFRGRINSVEFKKPRSFFKGKSYRVGTVSEGKSSDSFTSVIDRAEHGKETDITS